MGRDYQKVRVNRGRLAQAEHDEQLRKFLRENLDSLVRRQKLVVDGRIRTNISTLDLPTLEFGRPAPEALGALTATFGQPEADSGPTISDGT